MPIVSYKSATVHKYVLICAIHTIPEPGTLELADAIFSMIPNGCAGIYTYADDKHQSSTYFTEPLFNRIVGSYTTVISVHGHQSNRDPVLIGGRDRSAVIAIRKLLGLTGQRIPTYLSGRNPANICNRGTSGQGLQLEIADFALSNKHLVSWIAENVANIYRAAHACMPAVSTPIS